MTIKVKSRTQNESVNRGSSNKPKRKPTVNKTKVNPDTTPSSEVMGKGMVNLKGDYRYNTKTLKGIKIVRPLGTKQEAYLNDEDNDIIVWGGAAGSGKSEVSLIDMLICGLEDSNFRGMIIRKSKEVMKNAGSIFDSASQLYNPYGVHARGGNNLDFTFPNKAYIKLGGLEKPADKHNYQGSQVTRFLCDEGQQLPEEGVTYLNSRLRSKSKLRHQLKITCNPDKNSYLCRWLLAGGYLDPETGDPVESMDGKTTYMVEISGEVVFRESLQELYDEYGEAFIKELEPAKFVYYAARVEQNPWIRKHQPSYIGKLKNLPPVERKQLYEGNWFADADGGTTFKKDWCTMIDLREVPKGLRKARAWDKAGTKPHAGNRDPDWTVGIRGCMDESGNLYIEHMERLRDRPAIVQKVIEETAAKDSKECLVGIPKDPSASGIEASDNARSRLLMGGINCTLMSTRGSKELRFEPISILGQEGKIYVVRGLWNKAFFDELEQLDFYSRAKGRHDDIADAMSDLYVMLTKRMQTTTINPNKDRRMQGGSTILNRTKGLGRGRVRRASRGVIGR